MGIFDRLKGRGRGADQQGGGPELSAGGDGTVPAPEPPGGDAAGTTAAPVRGREWAGLPPIRLVTLTPARQTVASSEFGGSLTAWQNPSFSGTLSHAVLADAPTGLIKDTQSFTPGPGPARLDEPRLSLPAAAPEGGADAGATAVDGGGGVAGGSVGQGPRGAWQGPSVQRAQGPRVAPAQPRKRPAPSALTRASAPNTVQRRSLPAAAPSRTAAAAAPSRAASAPSPSAPAASSA
ncbi:hypothetical protein AB0886_23450, partial [Streptomyces sp. NPDC024062]